MIDKNDPVVLVGEYTLPSGPSFDNYSIVIVHKSGKISEFGVDEVASIILQLETIINIQLKFGLCNSIKLASRVVFPPELEGHQLLKFEEPAFSLKEFFETVARFGLKRITIELTHEVNAYIQHCSNNAD